MNLKALALSLAMFGAGVLVGSRVRGPEDVHAAPPAALAAVASAPVAPAAPSPVAVVPAASPPAAGMAAAAPPAAPAPAPTAAPRPAMAAAPPVVAMPPPVAAAAPPPPAEAGPKPRIHFDTRVQSFGAVAHGTVVRRSFAFRNDGQGELRLESVRTSCGCTAALPSKKVLAPGESAAIDVTFDTARKASVAPKLHYANAVTVLSNDPEETEAATPGTSRLTLEGDVLARYRITPEQGAFVAAVAGVSGAAPSRALLTVTPVADAASLADARVVSAPAWTTIDGPRPTADGRGLELTIGVAADTPAGAQEGTLVLGTADREQPEVLIAVRGQVLPKIQATPSRFTVSLPLDTRSIVLTGSDAIRVVAAEVEVYDGGAPPLAVAAPLPAPDRRLILTVAPVPGAPARAGPGEVRLLIADPQCPLVRVPFRAFDPLRARSLGEAATSARVRVAPTEVDLGEAVSGRDLETSIMLARLDPAVADPLEPTDVAVEPAGALEARVEPTGNTATARIALHIRAGRPGPVEAVVAFRPRPGADVVRVPFTLHVLPVVTAYPGAVFLERREPRTLRVGRLDGKPVKVTGVRDMTGACDVTALEAAPGSIATGTVTVRVTPKPGAPAGPVRGTIEVTTDDPTLAPLAVPVFGGVE